MMHQHHHHHSSHGDREQLLRSMSAVHPVSDGLPTPVPRRNEKSSDYRWFPSWRLLTASMLCLCFACVHMMNANMGMAIVCMVQPNGTTDDSTLNDTLSLLEEVEIKRAPRMNWTAEEQGYIFSAFNLGLMLMLVTGFLADKLNSKWLIIASVVIATLSNVIIAAMSEYSVYWAIAGRFLVGLADAMLQPSVNSLITRWYPNSERSYALGLATGGRQIGSLVIGPVSGALCSQTVLFGGWPSIFYISAFLGVIFIIMYTILGADKPSKQSCISDRELKFITDANSIEDVGKKRTEREVPWMKIVTSSSVWASVAAIVCHEFPLMTMIMFLPSYLHDVHHYKATENGILSSLPALSLWIAKIGSSYANTWLQNHTNWRGTTICKILNGVGSFGLGVFLYAATLLDSTRAPLAVLLLCLSMASAGLHTPGCQTSLVAVAPAYSGAITGFAFFFVAASGIFNPLITTWIVQNQTAPEWNLVFYISAVIAIAPCVFFSIWGSSDVEPWAASPKLSREMNRDAEKTDSA